MCHCSNARNLSTRYPKGDRLDKWSHIVPGEATELRRHAAVHGMSSHIEGYDLDYTQIQ